VWKAGEGGGALKKKKKKEIKSIYPKGRTDRRTWCHGGRGKIVSPGVKRREKGKKTFGKTHKKENFPVKNWGGPTNLPIERGEERRESRNRNNNQEKRRDQ